MAPEDAADAERARELTILNAIAEAPNSSVDVRNALDRTLALLTELLDVRTGWIWLRDPETNSFYLAAAQNLPPFLQELLSMSGRWCICTDAFRAGRCQHEKRPSPLRRHPHTA